MIYQVVPGSGAERAGVEGWHRDARGRLEIGDTVTAIDDQPVKSGSDLILLLEKRKQGERVRLTLVRDGRQRVVQTELGSAGGETP